MSVSVEYSTKEISVIVLTNVLKMCQRRNLIRTILSLCFRSISNNKRGAD